MTAKKKEKTVEEKTAQTYTKSQIVNSTKFAANRDVLNALLIENRTYTLEKVEVLIKEFIERKVK